MLPTKSQFIWPSGFRGEDFWKSANQKQELPMATIFVNGSGQHKQSWERTFHGCFLPSFTSFGWGVSEEKIKMWKVNGRRTPSDGKRKKLLNTLKAVDFSCFLFSVMNKQLGRWINLTLEFCIHLMPYPTELISQLDITAWACSATITAPLLCVILKRWIKHQRTSFKTFFMSLSSMILMYSDWFWLQIDWTSAPRLMAEIDLGIWWSGYDSMITDSSSEEKSSDE